MDPKLIGAPGTNPPAPAGVGRPAGVPVQIPPAGSTFRDVLRKTGEPLKGEPVKFSAHAMQRLQSRQISLTSEDVAKINAMADKAAEKGAKQSLFMMRDVAMVVSIKNRVVITAVDQDSMRENVFTNIDSAAIL